MPSANTCRSTVTLCTDKLRGDRADLAQPTFYAPYPNKEAALLSVSDQLIVAALSSARAAWARVSNTARTDQGPDAYAVRADVTAVPWGVV
ncbi:MAG TPA: hypothetical protein VED20_10120 [Streptosporangiaceae bacterium]|nr:hypothetical protein [Streptosporangiaceae bacterium]